MIIKHLAKVMELPGLIKKLNMLDMTFGATALWYNDIIAQTLTALNSLGLPLNKQWESGKKVKILILSHNTDALSDEANQLTTWVQQLDHLFHDVIEVTVALLAGTPPSDATDTSIKWVKVNPYYYVDILRLVMDHHLLFVERGLQVGEESASDLLTGYVYAQLIADSCKKKSIWSVNPDALLPKMKLLLEWSTCMNALAEPPGIKAQSQALDGKNRCFICEIDEIPPRQISTEVSMENELIECGWTAGKKLVICSLKPHFFTVLKQDVLRWCKSVVIPDPSEKMSNLAYYWNSSGYTRRRNELLLILARQLRQCADSFDTQPVIIFGSSEEAKGAKTILGAKIKNIIILSMDKLMLPQLKWLQTHARLFMSNRKRDLIYALQSGIPVISLNDEPSTAKLLHHISLADNYSVFFDEADFEAKLERSIELFFNSEAEQTRVKSVIKEQLPKLFARLAYQWFCFSRLFGQLYPDALKAEASEIDIHRYLGAVPENLVTVVQKHFIEMVKFAVDANGDRVR